MAVTMYPMTAAPHGIIPSCNAYVAGIPNLHVTKSLWLPQAALSADGTLLHAALLKSRLLGHLPVLSGPLLQDGLLSNAAPLNCLLLNLRLMSESGLLNSLLLNHSLLSRLSGNTSLLNCALLGSRRLFASFWFVRLLLRRHVNGIRRGKRTPKADCASKYCYNERQT
jgi:hypothetical protein